MSHLYDRVTGLADVLAGFTEAPARSRDERAVYDAWRAAFALQRDVFAGLHS